MIQQGKCEAATVTTTCSASKKMREAAWRLCPKRARVGANCERHTNSFDRLRAEQRRRASMARVATILGAAMALS